MGELLQKIDDLYICDEFFSLDFWNFNSSCGLGKGRSNCFFMCGRFASIWFFVNFRRIWSNLDVKIRKCPIDRAPLFFFIFKIEGVLKLFFQFFCKGWEIKIFMFWLFWRLFSFHTAYRKKWRIRKLFLTALRKLYLRNCIH